MTRTNIKEDVYASLFSFHMSDFDSKSKFKLNMCRLVSLSVSMNAKIFMKRWPPM